MLRLQQSQDTRTKWCHHRVRKLYQSKGLRDWRSSLCRSCPLQQRIQGDPEQGRCLGDARVEEQISDSTPAFKAAIETKPVELVVGDASKTTIIGTNLDP